MNLTLIIAGVSAALSGAAGFALAWNLQAHQITKQELTHANERMAQQRAAHLVKERQVDTLIQAQNASAARAPVLRRGADAAAASGNGLHVSSEAAARFAATDPNACRPIIDAYAQIQLESVSFIREVARDIDQCLSDVQTLTDAWPKSVTK